VSDPLAEARRLLARAARPVVLCGAGLSAEAGLPTFRGEEGLWQAFRPEELATPQAFQRRPEVVWAWYRWRMERLAAVSPHAGHRALARWCAGRTGRLFNQNVDGLLEQVWEELGLDPQRLLALHGSLRRSHCERCGGSVPSDRLPPEALPLCGCGGRLRPSVVWFGEALQTRHLRALEEEARLADLVLAVGTSAQVWPAAGLLDALRRRGRPVLVLNPDPGAAQPGDMHLSLPAADGLPRLLEVTC
jgi:NAD-dependent deacetylase